MRSPSRLRRLLVAGASLFAALAGVTLVLHALDAGPRPARAAVVPAAGFQATVLGWSSWYGSYELAGLGRAWCIDHGSHAPDDALGYAPTDVADADPDTKAAMAWALDRHASDDAVGAAATMLVMHDLMGAQYPFGRLDVHQMGPGDLDGFAGHEAAVLDRARAIKDDALAHRHLRGPLQLHAEAPPVDEGQTAELVVRLTDANGAPVPGVDVHAHADGAALLAGGLVATGDDGVARFPYRAGAGVNGFSARAIAPDPALHAWGPTTAPAQRVARPATVDLDAAASFVVRPPRGRIRLDKTDLMTGQGLAGAVFTVAYDADGDERFETPAGQITSAVDAVMLADLTPGNYQLTEVTAPPGYEARPEPFVVHVPAGGTGEVDVTNTPRATVAFAKVASGPVDPAQASLAGARFVVTGPHDPAPEPPVIGDDDDGGEDPPSSTAPPPSAPPTAPPTSPPTTPPPPRPPEVGRCTTGADGRCALAAGALLAGRRYCYRETIAPPGFGRAEPGCFTTGRAGTTITVTVDEPSTFTRVEGRKRDRDTAKPLRGASYDLYRVDPPPSGSPPPMPLPRPTPPPDAKVLAGHTWVGRAVSDGEGWLRWPLQLPGFRYCALEHRAPPGYQRATELVCSETIEPRVRTVLDLPDRRLTTTTTTVSTTTTSAPPPGDRPPSDAPRPPGATGPPARQSALPVTGSTVQALLLLGGGLALLGTTAVIGARAARPPTSDDHDPVEPS